MLPRGGPQLRSAGANRHLTPARGYDSVMAATQPRRRRMPSRAKPAAKKPSVAAAGGRDRACAATVRPQGRAGAPGRMARRDRARRSAGKALKQLLIAQARRKLAGAAARGLADGSPYLWDLVRSRAGPLARVCSRPIPTRTSPHCSPKSGSAVAAAEDEAEAMRLLRRMKAEAALLIALADIGGVWPVDARHARADRARRHGDRRGGALPAARRRARAASSSPRDPAAPEAGQRLHRARHGQDGRVRAQLFERYRSHRLLRPGRARARRQGSSRGRSSCASRAAW